MVRRSPWLDGRAARLIGATQGRHALTIRLDVAREGIRNQVDTISELLRVIRTTARQYITDEWINEFAEHIATVVAGHHSAIASSDVANLDEKLARLPSSSG